VAAVGGVEARAIHRWLMVAPAAMSSRMSDSSSLFIMPQTHMSAEVPSSSTTSALALDASSVRAVSMWPYLQ
jgi:hypothetical protein